LVVVVVKNELAWRFVTEDELGGVAVVEEQELARNSVGSSARALRLNIGTHHQTAHFRADTRSRTCRYERVCRRCRLAIIERSVGQLSPTGGIGVAWWSSIRH
jgi:hypothetical protein